MTTQFELPPLPQGFEQPPPPHEAWLDGYISRLSASSLRLLKVCPEAWRNRYVLGRKERPGEALVLGSAFHDAIGYSERQKIETHEDLPTAEVVEFFHDKAWPEAIESDGGEDAIRWDNKPDEVRRDGERVTRAYHEAVSPRIQPLSVEQKFEIMVPKVPVPIIGYIDVEEERNVIDRKSGKQVQRKPDANWRTQGKIYTLATGKPTHFHSVSRAKTPSIATPLDSEQMVVTLHENEEPQLVALLQHYAQEIEMFFNLYGPDHPWPQTGVLMDYKGGAACNFCGYRKHCPMWAHERGGPA